MTLKYSIYIRTVSFFILLPAFQNWLKPVYGLFEQSDMHCTVSVIILSPQYVAISYACSKMALGEVGVSLPL